MYFPIQTNKPQVEYLFVDGAYLQCILDKYKKEYFENEDFEIDIQNLKSRFYPYKRLFYYDALPGKRSSEKEEDYLDKRNKKQLFLDKIRLMPGCHVFEGTVKGENGKNRQKKVDVMIAVDMLLNTIRNNMQGATLLAGDLDFKPVIDALVQQGMYTKVICDKNSASKEFIQSADEHINLSINNIYDCLDDNIKRKYPKPTEKSIEDLNLIMPAKEILNGVDNFGLKTTLYRKEETEKYLLVRTHTSNFGKVTYTVYEHNNKNFLIHFVEAYNISFQWNK